MDGNSANLTAAPCHPEAEMGALSPEIRTEIHPCLRVFFSHFVLHEKDAQTALSVAHAASYASRQVYDCSQTRMSCLMDSDGKTIRGPFSTQQELITLLFGFKTPRKSFSDTVGSKPQQVGFALILLEQCVPIKKTTSLRQRRHHKHLSKTNSVQTEHMAQAPFKIQLHATEHTFAIELHAQVEQEKRS